MKRIRFTPATFLRRSAMGPLSGTANVAGWVTCLNLGVLVYYRGRKLESVKELKTKGLF